jgi:hypothetical protein
MAIKDQSIEERARRKPYLVERDSVHTCLSQPLDSYVQYEGNINIIVNSARSRGRIASTRFGTCASYLETQETLESVLVHASL